jgi:uncharacterized membrane protein YfcA
MDGFPIAFCLFAAAVLYTSVGHAGASGYLAVMAFYSVAPESIRPAALVLNVIAAVPTVVQFVSAGHIDRRLFLALVAGSIPFVFLGSPNRLPDPVFRGLIALALLLAAIRLLWPTSSNRPLRRMPTWAGPLIGAPIGYLAGLTGIGGGVYLTPILLFARWADPKTAAGVSVSFILVNSIAGLIGQAPKLAKIEVDLWLWGVVVFSGGLIGSTLGSRFLAPTWLRRLLAVVLLTAVGKLLSS